MHVVLHTSLGIRNSNRTNGPKSIRNPVVLNASSRKIFGNTLFNLINLTRSLNVMQFHKVLSFSHSLLHASFILSL